MITDERSNPQLEGIHLNILETNKILEKIKNKSIEVKQDIDYSIYFFIIIILLAANLILK